MFVKEKLDLSVYFVADPAACAGRDIVDVVMMAVKGGVTMVQYRNKTAPMNDILAEAAMLREWVTDIPFLINDHIDVAQAVGADGVHLGQGDATPEDARRILGANAIVGQTAFTPDHMAAIDPKVVDYVGTGPVFSTKTDKGKSVLGPEKFGEIAALSPVPVVGIGGITPENTRDVLSADPSGIVQGVAMMRAISEAISPEDAARAFKECF